MKKKKTDHKTLALFDIDGTLIRSIAAVSALDRFPFAIKQVFGLDVIIDPSFWTSNNGVVDRGTLWALVKDRGISKKEFIKHLPDLMQKFCEYLDTLSQHGRIYEAIEEARSLVELLPDSSSFRHGLITGNLGDSGWWKLKHVGMQEYFSFGVFGHEADNRKALARTVFDKAYAHFGERFAPSEIVIIGDTVHDITCGKAIGAVTVAVTTGWNVNKEDLQKEKPDLLVDSLMDTKVLDLFHLPHY